MNRSSVDQSGRTVLGNLRRTADTDLGLLGLRFEGDPPDGDAEGPVEPVCTTLTEVPFRGSVDPGARGRSRFHISDDIQQ